MTNDFHLPSTLPLQNAVHSIWQTKGAVGFESETIIPKGIVEMIFNFNEIDALQSTLFGKQFKLPKCFILGFNTEPIVSPLPSYHFFLGVRFHPAAVKKIFGVPAAEFANTLIDLPLIDKTFDSLWHELAQLNLFDEKIRAISAWIETIYFDIDPREAALNHLLNNLNSKIPTVRELSELLCCSPRHLSRKITAITGMNTEETLLYKKYLHSVNLIHTSRLSLTAIAYQCNFTDQSHFIKTFKNFTDRTPGEYREQKSNLPGHIYEDVR